MTELPFDLECELCVCPKCGGSGKISLAQANYKRDVKRDMQRLKAWAEGLPIK